ncbi:MULTISPECIES: GNAT family N-acetyltransferase [unclassified Ruminococcus]|uniref:GNAT family N-acetyltransferase n=1 Tax=unclassified Ruminococcus TaxID=2608920 RepID=UPI00210B49AA|nr:MULTISPECIES: GNAT family N-acetyltransferase [unclassified Ruminococcus]MCQ4021474.1 GNAT family N-acetyltransferase [Ruminococcus sp. zg-924]MCQ4113919.1 GNAT family N-acetyltransferase [Ruminococcus sp. zg-921]
MVRYAKFEELGKVNELRKQVNELHCKGRPDIFRGGFCKEMQDIIFAIWENKDTDVIVAVRSGDICGFACVEYITKPLSPYNLERKYYHIVEFGVDKKYRRRGVATEMFEFIKEQAKLKGLDKIELDMWEFNEDALKFYEAIGFKTYRRYMEFDFT